MRFSHEGFYDADPAAVRAMLLDREFRSQVCDYQRVLRHSISIDELDGAVVVDVDQVQSTEYVPSTARAFVGAEIEIGQRETWHSPTEAALVVTIPGRPGRMDGAILLSERDGGTIETVHRGDQGEHPADRRQAGADGRPGLRLGARRPGPGRCRLAHRRLTGSRRPGQPDSSNRRPRSSASSAAMSWRRRTRITTKSTRNGATARMTARRSRRGAARRSAAARTPDSMRHETHGARLCHRRVAIGGSEPVSARLSPCAGSGSPSARRRSP